MDFTRISSLRHLALIKVCAELWDLSDIKDSMAKLPAYSRNTKDNKEWEAVENKVMEKVPQLPLPESLKKEMVYFIRPIGLEIYKWKSYLCNENCPPLTPEEYTLSVPCWTPQGTVERKKTANALVKDDNVDSTKRYILACTFCLEDDIKEFWRLLPQRQKEAFKVRPHLFNIPYCILVELWSHDINGELAKLNGQFKDNDRNEISAYEFAFKIGVLTRNKAAVEHFFKKLTPVERDASFVWYEDHVAKKDSGSVGYGSIWIRNEGPLCAEIFLFLLSQMNEEQQIKVLQSNPYKILSCFLEWPWQSFFMEVANRTRNFLSEHDYEDILTRILKKILSGFKDYNYHKLFREFFEQGPSTCKRYFIERCASSASSLLGELFDLEDEENIRLILKNATVEKREKIMLHEGKNICQSLIRCDKWDLLELFVQDCLSSEDVMIKFKEEFQSDMANLLMKPSDIGKYTKFYRILDDLISKNSKKRDMEEGTCSPAKRLK